MVPRHLLDSLAVIPYLGGMRIIDVGSGAGIPGIPLALALPDREFVLLDSSGKKSRFQTHVKGALGLQNVEVVNRRVEDYRPDRLFDTVITRAFASVTDILSSSRHLLASGGEMLAMKGALPESELETLPHGFQLAETINIKVPGLEQEQRHLLRIRAVEP
jgi:16S rRNA (guanine527-N7)-methyltransferase